MTRLSEEGMPEEGLCLGSLDVKALYPSLLIQEAAKICGEEVSKSDVCFEEVDWTWASVYCALNMTEREVRKERLWDVVPDRKKGARGACPAILTYYTDEQKTRWISRTNPKHYNAAEKRRLIGKVLQMGGQDSAPDCWGSNRTESYWFSGQNGHGEIPEIIQGTTAKQWDRGLPIKKVC